MKDDLIRFVTDRRHPPYGYRTGIFRNSSQMWRNQRLAPDDLKELRALFDWFNENLRQPERLSASRRHNGDETGISWIRSTANEHMKRLRRLAVLLESGGVKVHELRTVRPGYVLYEDEYQVVALPFSDTPR